MKRNGNNWTRSLLGGLVALGIGAGIGIPRSGGADPARETEGTAPAAPAAQVADSPAETSGTRPASDAGDSGMTSGASVAQESEAAVRRQRVHDLVSVGSNVEVDANQVADQVVVVNGDATIRGEVRGDVVVVFGKVRIDGKVRGDVVVVMGEAEVHGSIRGDTSLIMTRGKFGPASDFDGDVVAVGVPPEIDPAASLKSAPEIVSLGRMMGYLEGAKDYLLQGVLLLRPFPPRLGWVWIVAGAFLVFHLVLAWLLAGPLQGCMETVRLQPARSFLVGLLVCVLVGPVSLLLSFTVIAPLLIWVAFLALAVFGRVTAYGAAGAAMGRSAGLAALSRPVEAVLVGSVVLYLAYMIPVVGLMLYALALPLGIGAVALRVVEAIRSERPPRVGAAGGQGLAAASALVAGMPGPATHGFMAPGPMASSSGAGDSVGPGVLPGSEPPAEVPPSVPPAATGAIPQPPPPSPPPFVSAGAPPRVIPIGGMEALAMPRVGFWPRFGASMIDLVLIGVINLATFQSAQAFWVMLAMYHGALWAWRGTTLGGSVLNLRLVRLDGRPLDWQTAVVRVLGAVVSLVPLGLGFFWASWDTEFQAWHDRIAGTTVVKPERRVSLV